MRAYQSANISSHFCYLYLGILLGAHAERQPLTSSQSKRSWDISFVCKADCIALFVPQRSRTPVYSFINKKKKKRFSPHPPWFLVSSASSEERRNVGSLKEVVDALQSLSVRFSLEYLTTVGRLILYRNLIDALFPPTIYRTLFSKGEGGDILSRVKRMCIPPCIKTFFFKLHTATLPVKV